MFGIGIGSLVNLIQLETPRPIVILRPPTLHDTIFPRRLKSSKIINHPENEIINSQSHLQIENTEMNSDVMKINRHKTVETV